MRQLTRPPCAPFSARQLQKNKHTYPFEKHILFWDNDNSPSKDGATKVALHADEGFTHGDSACVGRGLDMRYFWDSAKLKAPPSFCEGWRGLSLSLRLFFGAACVETRRRAEGHVRRERRERSASARVRAPTAPAEQSASARGPVPTELPTAPAGGGGSALRARGRRRLVRGRRRQELPLALATCARRPLGSCHG